MTIDMLLDIALAPSHAINLEPVTAIEALERLPAHGYPSGPAPEPSRI